MNPPTSSSARSFFALLLIAATITGSFGADAEPEVDLKQLPRLPAVAVDQALSSFQVKRGFHLELVAAEPLVRDPIEICFDENGRMFVVEMIDYSEMRDAKPHLGRISMLEDTNGDGRFDKSTVFVDDLPWPTGVFWANGGLYVAATPDIFFCKDTTGDGKADKREVVFTGFGIDYAPYQVTRLNMQSMLNSLRWGLDNRIHGMTAPNGGDITSPLNPKAKPVNVRRRDFVVDPRTQALATEAGGGQYGLAYDDRGRRYTCNNSDHIRVFMYDTRYESRNPHYTTMPPVLQSIAVDGPSAEVYRTSPDEPWRLIRTQWRISGASRGIVEGGGRVSGYFTSATGLMIYRGSAFPEEYVGDAFIADCGSNLIHRKKVREDGITLLAERPADEQRTEFITSTDTWFRPVQMANAPDGTLYVIDMYREIIEHPWSLPPSLKKHLDLNSGNDRGRIYRVVPDGFKQPPLPRLGAAGTAELVSTLDHRNGWHRDTAARLLFERQDKSAAPLLEKLLRESKSPLGRMHALWALDGQGALNAEQVTRALGDTDDRVREHAVRLAERFLGGKSTAAPALSARLLALAEDPSIRVRYQLAFTLGEMRRPEVVKALATIIRRDAGDMWVRAAVLSSLAEGAGEMFRQTVGLTGDINKAAGESAEKSQLALQAFVRELVQVIGARNDTREVAGVLDYVAGAADPALAFALVHGLGEGLQRAKAALPADRVKPVIERASKLAADKSQAVPARAQAVELLTLTTFAESGDLLLSLLALNEKQPVQLAAMHTLGRFTDPKIGAELTQRWRSLTPRLRTEALALLVVRRERLGALLDAVEAKIIRRADLASPQLNFLMNHREPELRARAVKLLTATNVSTREEVVKTFMPALALQGDAAKGKLTYTIRCAFCHRLGGEGFMLGPDLVSVRNTGKEKLLIGILDPSREVLPQYLTYEIETKDGESQLGVLTGETSASVTLRQPFGKDLIIARANIATMRSRGQSIMPELEAGLTPQDMADLLEYIANASQ
ncbi:MAG: c-type cytochrome [Verrucomicrobia bacterium]|nr:c-type cytochrome [Verrucomicrobiota bacterium]